MTTPAEGGLSPKQWASIREATGVVNVWEGAISSGKTIGSLWRWLMFVRQAPTTGRLIMTGRTRDSLAGNVLDPMQDPNLFGLFAQQVKYNPGANSARILGRTVEIMGANDVQAEFKLRGRTVCGSYVDEVTTLPEGFFRQMRGRMRVPGAQMFATTNPDANSHWFKKKYLDLEPKGWRRFHFVMDDNPSLTDEYKAQMRRENVGLWHKRFILGEWVNAEGAIYEMWDEHLHVVPFESLPTMDRLLCVGMDYGTTNAAAGLMLGISSQTPDRVTRLYLIDEWRYDPADHQGRKMTDSQLSDSFRLWLNRTDRPCVHGMQPEWIIVDPAASSFKVQLRTDGLRNVMDAENSVNYGIRTVANLLAADLLKVSDRCAGFIDEAPTYAWDDKATESGEDKPKKEKDHSLDACRYAIASTETYWRGWVSRAA